MAEINVSLQQTHHLNPTLHSLFHALDPIPLILNCNSYSTDPFPLKFTTTESFAMERGPRYQAYAELRERKLRMRQLDEQEEERVEVEPKLTPPRKQVKFQTCSVSARKGSTSVLAQSVPDFSAALRKENRKPLNTLPTMMEMTPPAKSLSKSNGVSSNSRGSKSASAGEKRGGGILMARKSYASIDELKSLTSATANAINGENRGGRNGRVRSKTGFGYRQF